jgi:subtilisin family serine protease
MDWPGAYPQVISVGASGWKYEWYWSNYVTPPPRNRLWWLQSSYYPYNDIPESASDLTQQVYITDFSGIQVNPTGFSNCGINHDQACVQQLDVIAPGSWVRGPFPGVPGYSHLPWWSDGLGWFRGHNPGNFYYLGGTSMATPHVTSVVALMLQKDSTLTQIGVETILKSTALPIPAGSMTVWDLTPTQGWYTYSWESDATGAGLVQADAAVNAA